MFIITERLRARLELEQEGAETAKRLSHCRYLPVSALCSKVAEYRRGRADGIRAALEIIAETARMEARNG